MNTKTLRLIYEISKEIARECFPDDVVYFDDLWDTVEPTFAKKTVPELAVPDLKERAAFLAPAKLHLLQYPSASIIGCVQSAVLYCAKYGECPIASEFRKLVTETLCKNHNFLEEEAEALAKVAWRLLKTDLSRIGHLKPTKPSPEQLRQAMPSVESELKLLKGKIEELEKIDRTDSFEEIIGKSLAIRKIIGEIEKLRNTDKTVTITGETGTGKELVARSIHKSSPRCRRPFVVADLAGYPSSILESRLYGHEEGAFTGAVRAQKGLFELADGGTLFMDEVGDLDESCQVRLLRVLETGVFMRVGGTKALGVDVRVVGATNRDLKEAVTEGRFREDLFYRLNVFVIHVPPLRERKEDIPMLVAHFCQEVREGRKRIAHKAMEKLLLYNWPGNVRQLKYCMERAVVLAESNVIQPADIKFVEASSKTTENVVGRENLEKQVIMEALNSSESVAEAIKKLPWGRTRFYELCEKQGIKPKNHLRRFQ